MIEVTQTGLKELGEALQALADEGYKRIVPNALRRSAIPIRSAAKSKAPVLKNFDKRRSPGTLKKAIAIVTEKGHPKGIVGVRVKVKPLGGKKLAAFKATGLAGSKNPNDPFYWAAVEKGGGNAPAHPYLRPAYDSAKDLVLPAFTEEVGKELDKVWKKFK